MQITFVSCDGERARDVGLLKSKDPNVYNVESDPTVWHVVLPQGSELSTFSIGTTPPSAKEEVSIALPLSQDALYVAEVSGSTGHTYYQAFKLSELGDKIAFDHTYLSPSEFAQRSSCGTPTS